ncbi:hypothetical protein EKH80_22895 [Dyella choica]|uniref:HEAT repeat domain-containing protein n=1 Tax=Dyella choica TaxID=1927959 RepID=A0A432LZH8_9GAMM|nr:hypothetical protein EKH80_22895 [Dyella choica]
MDHNELLQCDDELRLHPIMACIEDALASSDAFVFADHLPLYETIFKSDLALQALKLSLQKIAANPDYQLPRFVMEGTVLGWTILATEHFRVSIGVRHSAWAGVENGVAPDVEAPSNPEQPKMEPYPFDLFLGILSVPELAVERYAVVPPLDESEEHRLEYLSEQVMFAGDSMYLAAGTDLTLSRLKGSMVYMEITGNSRISLLPRFDPRDKRFCGWVSGDPTASRIEILTRVLADFDYQPGVEVVKRLTHHRDHHVRWNSMRHLLRMSAGAGVERVRGAVSSDPNPDLRAVASQVLAQLAAEA